MILGILASAIRAANAAPKYDPYFDKVTALLHLDGADGSSTITDVTGRVWGAYSGAKLGTANPKFGTAALNLVGQVSGEANTTRLFTEAKNHTFGSRDFTVELFASQNRVDARSGVLAAVDYEDSGSSSAWRAWAIAIDGNGRPYARISSDGTSYTRLLADVVVPVEGYLHYALVRKGSLVRLFVDGIQRAEATFTGSMFESPIGITIGSWATAKSEAFQGKIDEFRITDGYARYWDNFAPPTQAFYDVGAPKPTDPYFANVRLLLHADSPDASGTIVDSSSKAQTPSSVSGAVAQSQVYKFGSGSIKASGSPSVLDYPASTDFDLAGVLTMEFWAYFEQYPTNTRYWLANSSVNYMNFGPSGNLSGSGNGFSVPSIPLNQWVHIAFSRDSSGTARSFMNGKLTNTDSASYTKAGSVPLGLFSIPGRTDLNGPQVYMDDFRFTAGVGRYTAEFTPPAMAFPDRGPDVAVSTDTYWSKVVMLTHMDSNPVVDQAGHTFLDTPRYSETNPKFGVACRDAAVAGSWLLSQSNDYVLGTGDYTVEFWAKPSALPPSNQGEFSLFGLLPQAARNQSGSNLFIVLKTDGSVKAYANEKEVAGGTGSILAPGKWSHVAVTRDSSSIYVFVDGVKVAQEAVTPHNYTNPAIFLGSYFEQSSWSSILFDELRITKGVARYTATFTPPVAAFPDAAADTATDASWSTVKSLLRMDTTPTQDLASSKPSWQKFGAGSLQSTVKLFNQPTMQMDGSTALESNIPFSAMGSGDYTAEVWFYPTAPGNSSTQYQRIISIQSDANDVLIARIQGSIMQVVMYVAGASGFFNNIQAPKYNEWNHIVVQRKSDNWEVFLNGTKVAGGAVVGGAPGSAVIALGGARRGDGGSYDEYFTGYLSNFRATAGVARYNDGYTLPTDRFPKQ